MNVELLLSVGITQAQAPRLIINHRIIHADLSSFLSGSIFSPVSIEGVHQAGHLNLAILGDSNTTRVTTLTIDDLKSPDLNQYYISIGHISEKKEEGEHTCSAVHPYS